MQAAAPSVLTVEDDPVVRADLRLVLEDAGFDVVAHADDGAAAVQLAREHKPDVIVLDLALAGLDGIEGASQRILAERRVPIVALTDRSHADVREVLGVEASSCIPKPFSPSQVVEAVTGALVAHREHEIRENRTTSLRSIESLVDHLSYATPSPDELEQRAWERGHVWRRIDAPELDAE